MRLTRLDQKLVAGIVGLFLLPSVLAAGTLVALYRWGAFDDTFTLLVTVVVGLATLMGYLGLIAHTIGQSLVRAVRQVQLGTELIATVNPAHRLEISTGDELQRLAEEINHLADRLAAARQDGVRAAARAAAELEAERARLARVLDALGEGVLVVTPEGRVSLANHAARALLGHGLLGRDLTDLVADAASILHAADGFRAGAHVAWRLALHAHGAGALEATVTPLLEGGGRLSGLAIVLRERASDAAEAVDQRAIPGPRGAGRASAAADGAREKRPELYDLSLLDDMDRRMSSDDRARRLDALTCTVLDVETTGLEPSRGDRIVSIACVRIRNGIVREAETLDVLVNPGRPIPPGSVRIHGITDQMVACAPTIDAIVPDVLRFADGTVLAGHEIWFDLTFLRETTDRLGVPLLTQSHPVLDTWLLSQFLHGPLGSHDLETVAARLGVSPQGRHSARGDAVMTAEILVRLFEILSKRGIGTLGEALEAMRRIRTRFTAATGAP